MPPAACDGGSCLGLPLAAPKQTVLATACLPPARSDPRIDAQLAAALAANNKVMAQADGLYAYIPGAGRAGFGCSLGRTEGWKEALRPAWGLVAACVPTVAVSQPCPAAAAAMTHHLPTLLPSNKPRQ